MLLTTPLIRSLRRAWPLAKIDMLVFADTAAILDGNPDIDDVIAMPQRPTRGESLALAARLWRRYDLAVTTQAGDRPTFFAVIAGRKRVGPVEARLIGRDQAARARIARADGRRRASRRGRAAARDAARH